MLWREGYQTKIVREFEVPPLDGRSVYGEFHSLSSFKLVLGGWKLVSLMEQRLWSKLARGEFPDLEPWLGLAASGDGLDELSELKASISREESARAAAWLDPEGTLLKLLQPDLPNRAFAICPAAGLAMVGPPTEDAWEEMCAALTKG